MTYNEIRDFKNFMIEKNAYHVFETFYRDYRMMINPPSLEEYFEKVKVDHVIPQAFVYPKGSLYGRNFWLTLNNEWNRLLTRSRQTTDVVLMFNRQRGIEVKFKPGSSGLLFNNSELCNQLMDLLHLDPNQDYFQLGIELLAETNDYLLFLLKKTK